MTRRFITFNFMRTTTLLMLAYTVIFFTLFFIGENFKQDNNVFNVSQIHLESKTQERLENAHRFFEGFTPVLYAIHDNKSFQNFVANGHNSAATDELFVTLQKSLNCISEIAFINASGQERLKVIGPATRYTKKHLHEAKILSAKELQNRANEAFFKRFSELRKGQIGLSNIENQTAYKEVGYPKRPMIRFGLPVYQQGQFKGVIVLTICLKDFFNLFLKTTLYDVFIANHNGEIILHPTREFIQHQDADKPLMLAEVFGSQAADQMLVNTRFFNDTDIYSQHFHILDSDNSYLIILKAKFKEASNYSLHSLETLGISLLLALLLTLPIAFKLSRQQQQILLELDEAAHIDELTHLPNKTSLLEAINRNQNFDVVLISIDHFFELTKVYGYQPAEEMIQAFAKNLSRLANTFQYESFHLEKDQFVLLFPSVKKVSLATQLTHLKNLLEKQGLMTSTQIETHITLSMGIAHYNRESMNAHDALLEAERSLIEARKLQFAFVLPQPSSKTQQKNDEQNLWMLKQIRHAANNNGVEVHYQPIQNAISGEVHKFEALMRIRDEYDHVLMPNDFLPLAKASQYYPQLSQQLIHSVVQTLASLPSHKMISINLSALDIHHPEVMDTLISQATRHKVTGQLVIEIVESEDLGEIDEIKSIAQTLHNFGFKLAIDDFGSGYANYHNLIQIAPYIDILKIDGSIVQPCLENPEYLRLLSSMQEMANSLNLKTVAEFVESAELAQKMREIGITYLQGYHIGKPDKNLNS